MKYTQITPDITENYLEELLISRGIENVEQLLDGRKLDYLVVSHVEPDHSAAVADVVEKYPDVIVIGSETAFKFMEQFFPRLIYSCSTKIFYAFPHTTSYYFPHIYCIARLYLFYNCMLLIFF